MTFQVLVFSQLKIMTLSLIYYKVNYDITQITLI